MKLREIKALIKLIQGTDIKEIELARDNSRVRISREVGEGAGGRAETPAVSREGAKVDKVYKTIASPMVGTFYRTPSPDAQPYVAEGSVIRKGQVVCIIEAMKLMNEIESEFDGKVVSVLVGNAQPVEYGEALFLLEPL